MGLAYNLRSQGYRRINPKNVEGKNNIDWNKS